jgi:hypothetical protein
MGRTPGDEKLFGHLGFTDPHNQVQRRHYASAKARGLHAVHSLGFRGSNFYGTPDPLRDEHVEGFVAGAKTALSVTPFSYLNHLVPTNELEGIQ